MTKILFISAHADDAIVAVGGVISLLSELDDYDIHYVAFSIAEDSVPDGFDREIVGKECEEACEYLGIDRKKTIVKRYRVRRFPEIRQDILDDLITLKKDIRPRHLSKKTFTR